MTDTLTPEQLAQSLGVSAALVEKEFPSTMRGVGISAVTFCKEHLTTEVYAIPEDRTPAGRKKWTRTGALRRGERAEYPDPFTVVIINDVNYSEYRHAMGKPGRQGINPLRESHWRDDLAEAFHAGLLLDLFNDTVEAILAGKKS